MLAATFINFSFRKVYLGDTFLVFLILLNFLGTSEIFWPTHSDNINKHRMKIRSK